MSRRLNTTKWLSCMLVLFAGPIWSPVRSISVQNTPPGPGTVEAQAKFFQYRHSPTHEDFDQGHRLGNDRHFTERHERVRPSTGLYSAKVRWGDKQGGYGEHYWDLNHAGHGGDHDNGDYDDGQYHEHDNHDHHGNDDNGYRVHDDHSDDPYDEPSEQHPTYENSEYDPEKSSKYGPIETSRPKRAFTRVKPERKVKEEPSEEEPKPKPLKNQKVKDTLKAAASRNEETFVEETDDEAPPEIYKRPTRKRQKHRPAVKEPENEEEYYEDEHKQPKETKQYDSKENNDAQEQPSQHVPRKHKESNNFVPYENGAGVRQHQQPVAAPPVPRLFLEPSTGHVVDRATGQAYILQPITTTTNYN